MLYYKKDIHFEGPAPHIYENQPVETFSETEVHDEAKKGTEAAEKQKAIDEKAKAERERLSVEVNLGQEEKAKKEAEIKKAEEQLGSLSKDIENAEDTPLVLNPDFEEPENYVMLPEEKVEAKPEDVTAEEVAQVVAEGESGGAMASLAAAFGSAGKFLNETGKKIMEWLGKGLDSIKAFFGGKKEEILDNAAKINAGHTGETNLGRKLSDVMSEHIDWSVYASKASDKFNIPEGAIWAIAREESNFDPSAKPIDKKGRLRSSAGGLGQFIDSSWNAFVLANPEFKDKDRADPEAGFYAIAWLSRRNADRLGIDTSSPDAVSKIYTAHHEGEEGYKRLQAFRTGGYRFNVPSSYVGHTAFDITVKDKNDCENYSRLIETLSSRVDNRAAKYQVTLDEAASSEALA